MVSLKQTDGASSEAESGDEGRILGGEELAAHLIESDSSNSDESQVPEAMLNSNSAFRVSVCLKRYYTDVRARCYILVPRNRRVRWLQRRLQKLFPLLVNFHLSTNGHVLPVSEPLALLTPEDVIDVIPYQETRANMISHIDDACISLGNNKRKGSALNTPNSNKLSNSAIYPSAHEDSNKRFLNFEKNVISSNCSLQDDIDGVNISPALKERSTLYLNDNDFKSTNKFEEPNNTETLFNLKQQPLVETNTTEHLDHDSLLPSRRRRRVRKRKRHMQTLSQPEYQSLTDFSIKDCISTPISIEQVPCNEDVTETSKPDTPSMDQSSTERFLLSPQHEVARSNTETLFNLKQQALALLESQVAVETNTTEHLDHDSLLPSRRRRRVRKRKRQLQTLSETEYQSLTDFSAKEGTSTPTSIEPVPFNEDKTETSNPDSPSMEQSSTDGVLLSPQHEVARNSAICSRKPRLFQSLNC